VRYYTGTFQLPVRPGRYMEGVKPVQCTREWVGMLSQIIVRSGSSSLLTNERIIFRRRSGIDERFILRRLSQLTVCAYSKVICVYERHLLSVIPALRLRIWALLRLTYWHVSFCVGPCCCVDRARDVNLYPIRSNFWSKLWNLLLRSEFGGSERLNV